MKITDMQVLLTRVQKGRTWLFVKIDTDEGITGFGEGSSPSGGGSLIVGKTGEIIQDMLIGENPRDIDRIWHKIYRRFTYLGNKGPVTCIVSAVDIALWDIKGKALGVPIYDLIGGRFRDKVKLYTHVDTLNGPEGAVRQVKELLKLGFTAFKSDPYYREMAPHDLKYTHGNISSEGEQQGLEIMAALREAVGPNVDLMIDAHGMYNVPTAIRLMKNMAPYKLTWFEEPVPPDGFEGLERIRQAVDMPICVGERLYTRWDYVPIFKNHLADYVMPDVVWAGGISEMKKIANMAEAYYIPVSPHDTQGPINILAGAHTMTAVPNFYQLEFANVNLENYNACIDPPLDIQDGHIILSDRPGLGHDLNLDYIREHPDIPSKGYGIGWFDATETE